MRQPQAKKSSLFRNDSRLTTPALSNSPAGTPICGQAAVKAAPSARRMLDRHQHGAAPFAADADALEDAQRQQHAAAPRSPADA